MNKKLKNIALGTMVAVAATTITGCATTQKTSFARCASEKCDSWTTLEHFQDANMYGKAAKNFSKEIRGGKKFNRLDRKIEKKAVREVLDELHTQDK